LPYFRTLKSAPIFYYIILLRQPTGIGALSAAVRDAKRQGAALRQFHRVLKMMRGKRPFQILLTAMVIISLTDATLQYFVVQQSSASKYY
jgi:hypothetical protein